MEGYCEIDLGGGVIGVALMACTLLEWSLWRICLYEDSYWHIAAFSEQSSVFRGHRA